MKKKISLLMVSVSLFATTSAFAGDQMTAITLQILNARGYQAFRQTQVTRAAQMSFSEQYGYPVAVSYADGSKPSSDLYNGSWRLAINKVTYLSDGAAIVDADLIEKPAGIEGRSSTAQHVALTIAGAKGGVIHGADGRDYVLSLHRLSDAVE
ncbi:hypothetical protein ACT2FY_00365 [Paraburkholderia fungorum]|uniref:hypothetical protein n=1 Tax=Paraburkholderia fungorum TaxID=134537 RepID=UPI00402B439C